MSEFQGVAHTILTQVGHDLLEPAVIVFRRLQQAHFILQLATILLLSLEVSRLTDPGLPTNFRDRRALCNLLQNEHLLRLRELRRFHANPHLS